MTARHTSQAAALGLALLVAVVVTSITTGETSTRTCQLKGAPTELPGARGGWSFIPSIGPPGTLVVAGNGVLEFGPVGAGTGVSFRPGGEQATDTAHYSFGGRAVGHVFNVNGGDITLLLKSRSWFADRQLGDSTWVFDVYDASHNLSTFYVSTDGGNLMFNYRAGRVVTNSYVVPRGQEEAIFGSDVVLSVRLAWDESRDYLYARGDRRDASSVGRRSSSR